MTKEQDEFYAAVVIYGAIIMLGGLFLIGMTYLVYKIKQGQSKREVANELYNEKERKNGQSKSGSRGHY